MTATPPSTSPPPDTLPNTTLTLALDLYRQCVQRGEWAKVVLEARGDGEHVSFFSREAARGAQNVPTPQQGKKKHVRKSRRLRNRRRRLAWLEKKNQHVPPTSTDISSSTCSTADPPPERVKSPEPLPPPPIAERTRAKKRRRLADPLDSPENVRDLSADGDTLDYVLSPTSPISPASPSSSPPTVTCSPACSPEEVCTPTGAGTPTWEAPAGSYPVVAWTNPSPATATPHTSTPSPATPSPASYAEVAATGITRFPPVRLPEPYVGTCDRNMCYSSPVFKMNYGYYCEMCIREHFYYNDHGRAYIIFD